MYCRNCGNEVNESDKFCSRCGNGLEVSKVVQEEIEDEEGIEHTGSDDVPWDSHAAAIRVIIYIYATIFVSIVSAWKAQSSGILVLALIVSILMQFMFKRWAYIVATLAVIGAAVGATWFTGIVLGVLPAIIVFVLLGFVGLLVAERTE